MLLRRPVTALAAAVLIGVAGCGTTPTSELQPGGGQAATEASETSSQDRIEDEGSGVPDPSPSGEAEGGGAPDGPQSSEERGAATFKGKHKYPDGVEVQVSRIKRGKVSARDVNEMADQKEGTPWVQFTVRIHNGSRAPLGNVSGYYIVSYGPGKSEAAPAYVPTVEDTNISEEILPGESKMFSETFVIPVKYQDDVALEVRFSHNYESIIFSGSLD